MDTQQKQSLVLRDRLAVDRTHMANERTLLAYSRTAMMLAASGITLLKLFPESHFWRYFGFFLIPIAVVVAIIGVWRFFAVRCKVTQDCAQNEQT